MKIKELIQEINNCSSYRAVNYPTQAKIGIYTPTGARLAFFDYKVNYLSDIKFYFMYLDKVEAKKVKDLGNIYALLNLINDFVNTPVKERFPEKKYRLVANPNSLEQTGTYATKYVACIQDGMDGFSFIYGEPTVFSEKELKQIEELHPNIAPAIDAMKEEVKDDEAD